jgi:outer membrane protein
MKKSINSLCLALFIIVFSITNIFAQKEWTLEECIKYALDNNIQIKRQELQKEVVKNNYIQSKMQILPSLNASGYHSLNNGQVLNQAQYKWESATTEYGQYGLNSNLTLFSGLTNYYNIQANKFNLLKNLQDVEKAKNDLILNIATAYLQVLYNMELLDVAKGQLEVTQLEVEKRQKLLEVGNIAKGTLLEIQAQAASEQVSLTNSENQLTLTYLTLSQLLELDSATNFRIVKPVELSVDSLVIPNSVLEVFSEAETKLPEIKSAEFQLSMAEQQYNADKGRRYPILSLYASYSSWYSAKVNGLFNPVAGSSYGIQLFDQNLQKSIGLNINIPIFNNYSIQNKISNSKINVLDSKYSYELSKKVLYKEIQQAQADAIAAYENYKSNKQSVIANEESFKYVQQKYDVGLVNAVDYNTAKNSLAKAKSDLLQAKYDFIFKTKILDFYKGNPIKL